MATTINRQERDLLHDHARLELDADGISLYWSEEARMEKAKSAARRVVAAVELLDQVGWVDAMEGETCDIAMNQESIIAHVREARDWRAQCLSDDEAMLPKGLADPDYRAEGQSAEEFKASQQARIDSERKVIQILDGLLARLASEEMVAV